MDLPILKDSHYCFSEIEVRAIYVSDFANNEIYLLCTGLFQGSRATFYLRSNWKCFTVLMRSAGPPSVDTAICAALGEAISSNKRYIDISSIIGEPFSLRQWNCVADFMKRLDGNGENSRMLFDVLHWESDPNKI